MLVRFRFKNILSFYEETEFSMVSGLSTEHKTHTIPAPRNYPTLLKAAAIYGANASGKSNFVKALAFMKSVIVGNDITNPFVLTHRSFRMNKKAATEPSSVECEIKIGDTFYAYGFDIALDNVILSEWLHEIGATKDKMLFERKTTPNGSLQVKFGIRFGTKDEQRLQFIGLDSQPQELLLRNICKRNTREIIGIEPLFAIFRWFENDLVIIDPQTFVKRLEVHLHNYKEMALQFEQMLKHFNTRIDKIETLRFEFDSEQVAIPFDMKESIINELTQARNYAIRTIRVNGNRYSVMKEANGEIFAYEIVLLHKKGKGKEVELLKISEESDGNQRLLDLLGIFFLNSKTIIVDEIDRSLHPNLSRGFLEEFFALSEKKTCQLIFTTHEASLLDLDLFRRDEIWFVERNAQKESRMYSLEEYKPRPDKDIETGYLLGRYGAIPFIGNVQKLGAEEE